MYDVTDFGAKGSGNDKDTDAIQKAIDACADAGGGTVYFPPGTYLSGTIFLKDNVEIRLDVNAAILGSPDLEDYFVPEGVDYKSRKSLYHVHLINAKNVKNIAITGRGTIDGNGRAFFGPPTPESPSKLKRDWRPGHMIALRECQNVKIQDVHLVDSTCYHIWPLGCDNVHISGVTIFSEFWNPNSDGIDPDCCSNVRISDCDIYAGDDAIAVKSDAYTLGKEKACENITVTNCKLSTCCCGIRIGYEGDNPIRNCTFSNIVMHDTRTGIDMLVPHDEELWPVDHGPAIENISFSNFIMNTRQAILIVIADEARSPGCVRNINISDMFATTERGCYLGGSNDIPIDSLRINNFKLEIHGMMDDCFGDAVPYPYRVWDYWNTKGIPYGIFCRNMKNSEFRDVTIKWEDVEGSWKNAMRFEDVQDTVIHGLRSGSPPSNPDMPVIRITNGRDIMLSNCKADSGTNIFARFDGEATEGNIAISNDFRKAGTGLDIHSSLPKNAVEEAGNTIGGK